MTEQQERAEALSPLRVVREAQQRSLGDVAREARVSPEHLSRVERRLTSVSIEALYRVGLALRMDALTEMIRPYLPIPTPQPDDPFESFEHDEAGA